MIIGIDPSLCHTGCVALVRGPVERNRQTFRAVSAITLHTTPKHGPQSYRVDLQIRAVERWLQSLVAEHMEPDLVVVEELAGVVAGKTKAGRTSAAAAWPVRVGQGVRTLTALLYGWDRVAWVTPAQRLQAVGLPKSASKQQVKRAVGRRVDGLPEIYSEHVADAVAIALAGRAPGPGVRSCR